MKRVFSINTILLSEHRIEVNPFVVMLDQQALNIDIIHQLVLGQAKHL